MINYCTIVLGMKYAVLQSTVARQTRYVLRSAVVLDLIKPSLSHLKCTQYSPVLGFPYDVSMKSVRVRTPPLATIKIFIDLILAKAAMKNKSQFLFKLSTLNLLLFTSFKYHKQR